MHNKYFLNFAQPKQQYRYCVPKLFYEIIILETVYIYCVMLETFCVTEALTTGMADECQSLSYSKIKSDF